VPLSRLPKALPNADSARVYAVGAQLRSCAQITLIGVPRLVMAEKPAVRKNAAPGESQRRGMRIGFGRPRWWEPWARAESAVSFGLSKVWSGVRSRPAAFRV